ncbi:SPOR domain-containing protein [Candidatus Thiosymbion oneisti]|uniref:SPOR domain-containing protein n=1 Tax=Candidatus Thiosymbion oneisti TaxID=589554 RepID=UPI0013FDBD0A|nr:SPOR domain-containing protein [Candidatus Thiosymbion oneisti]
MTGAALLLSLGLPTVAQGQRWDQPIPGYKQVVCYGTETKARAQLERLVAQGLDSRILYKDTVGCWSVNIREQRAAPLTYQIGAFRDRTRARRVVESVDTCGFRTEITEITRDQTLLYRVRTSVSSDAHAQELFALCLQSSPFIPSQPMLITE